MTFTKERLEELAAGSSGLNLRVATPEESMELARIALASLEAEPALYCMGGDALDEESVSTRKAIVDGWVDEWNGEGRCPGEPQYRTIPLYTAPPAPVSVPETLPCPVLLEPGMRFGKGVRTKTMLDALQRRANYCAELEAMTPGQRAEHDAGMKEFAAMLQGSEPVTTAYMLQEETGSSLQLRNLIRQRHAEWSRATFGDVGPIGPLKHLSKEALEAAEEPDDLSEWADMQFLLWDAQRRAGISDGEITAAMEEKLKVNMARQWPEPKDGEPRLHIKAAPQQEAE